MKKRILIAAFVCLSAMAIAQSSNNQTASTAKETQPRDRSNGQASGKTTSQPAAQPVNPPQNNGGQTTRESSAPSVSEVVVTKSSDKSTPRVATGDVNGDGHADVAATASTNNNHSNTKDVATGQMSGKRQHEPVVVKKEVDLASPSK